MVKREGDWACSGQKRRREDRVVAGRGVADDADAGDGDGRSSLVGHFPVKKASNMQAFLKTLKAPTWEKRAESGAEQGAERGEAGPTAVDQTVVPQLFTTDNSLLLWSWREIRTLQGSPLHHIRPRESEDAAGRG